MRQSSSRAQTICVLTMTSRAEARGERKKDGERKIQDDKKKRSRETEWRREKERRREIERGGGKTRRKEKDGTRKKK